VARILLIDDDPSIRRSVPGVLRRLGHEVLTAEHGDDGLRLWGERGADLVITDLCMPGRNGLEVIVQLRHFAPDLPLIAISGGSGSAALDLLGTARLAGALHTLAKPFTVEELRSTVGAALDGAETLGPQPAEETDA
jgi:DNA-binding NtrC family response regulator